jgi:hypothetical protein
MNSSSVLSKFFFKIFSLSLYKFYLSRIPGLNSTDYFAFGLDKSPLYNQGGLGRSGSEFRR